jgi:hypothetical protein
MRVFLSAILIACVSASGTLHAVSVERAKVSPKSISVDTKQVPNEINYQGWLGEASDSSGFSGTPAMIFHLYAASTGGVSLWSETHMAVPVDKGIFHVLLGTVSPLTTDLFTGAPLWLETIVGIDTLAPRKKMVSVAYAIRADSADKAYDSYLWDGNKWGVEYPKANKSDTAAYAVGGGGAAYADSAGHLVGPDVIKANTTGSALTVRNENGNGVGLTLQTPTSSGTNISLEIENNPDTAIYLDSGGYYGLVIGSLGQDAIKINRSAYGRGVHILVADEAGVEIDSVTKIGLNIGRTGTDGIRVGHAHRHGVYVADADSHGVVVANADRNAIHVESAGRYGVYVDSARYDGVWVMKAVDDGFYVTNAGGDAFYASTAGDDGVEIVNAGDDGLRVGSAGDNGLYIGNAADDGIWVNNATDYGIYAYGKYRGAHFESDSTANAVPTLYVKNRAGATNATRLAYFYGNTNLAFYFLANGAAYADVGWNTFKKGDAGGVTPYHTMQSRDVEIVSSGTARLVNGTATIALDKEISSFVSGNVDLKITATPKGSWSGLYVSQQSGDRFVVKSDAGDLNASFDWIVIARERGFDVRTQFTAEQVQEILQPSEDIQEELQEQQEEQNQVRLSE